MHGSWRDPEKAKVQASRGLCFSVSSSSTGGLFGLPPDADDFAFFFVGLYCLTGIPVMGLAFVSMAGLIIEEIKRRDVEKKRNLFNEIGDVINE